MNAWRLTVVEETSSTSDDCIAAARAGEPAGLAILAQRQTAGRGSRGRHWQAPAGNLNLSVLLRPDAAPAAAGIFALTAGLAVAEALDRYLPETAKPTLKWPNDILLRGEKLAGILIDAAPTSTGLDWLVIGIGANLVHAPVIEGRATTALADHVPPCQPLDLANAILARLTERLAATADTVHTAWRARAHPHGTKLEIRTGATTLTGQFAGLAANGALLLEMADGTVNAVNTGELMLSAG